MAIFYEQGRYICRITDHGLSESSKKGTPFVFIKVRPISYLAPGTHEPESVSQSFERTINKYLTDKTVENVARDLRNIGFDGDSFAQLDRGNDNAVNLTGQDVECYCEIETFTDQNGQTKEKETWNIAFTFEMKPIDAKAVRSLDAMFGKALKNAPKKPKDALSNKPAKQPVGAGSPANAAQAEFGSPDDLPPF